MLWLRGVVGRLVTLREDAAGWEFSGVGPTRRRVRSDPGASFCWPGIVGRRATPTVGERGIRGEADMGKGRDGRSLERASR
jgi:hypothetical protein